MVEPGRTNSPIRFQQTERGFYRGEFYDENGVECSIQESSLATAGAVRLGPDKSADRGMYTPDRMHLGPDEYNLLNGLLANFATTGELPARPITFRDLDGTPCMFSAANSHEVFLGIVLPKRIDGSQRLIHDRNMYYGNGDEIQLDVDAMFKRIYAGSVEMVEIDNRMLLSRRLVGSIVTYLRQMIAKGEDRSIE